MPTEPGAATRQHVRQPQQIHRSKRVFGLKEPSMRATPLSRAGSSAAPGVDVSSSFRPAALPERNGCVA
jgi:hypothetical protein